MAGNIACVVYLPNSSGSVEAVEQRLSSRGYEVHSFEIAKDRAAAIKNGQWDTLPKEIEDCLKKAVLVILLIDEDAELLGPIAGLGSDAGCRIVSVGGSPDELPEGLDDIIDGHLPNVDVPKADEVIGGKSDRIDPSGERSAPRKPSRVKCQ